MSTEQRRTLVVSHDFLADWRDAMYTIAQSDPGNRAIRAVVNTIDDVISHGTVVDLSAYQVTAAAERLVSLAEAVIDPEWAAKEREQFYSEAQAVDADWTPSGGAA